jgi:hypothetical protein
MHTTEHRIHSYSVWRTLPQENGYAWEKVAEQKAHHFSYYSMTIPTLYDSISLTDGMHHYLVCAHTADKNRFYTSGTGNGYSVDNLAPRSPGNLAGSYEEQQVILHWNPNEEADLKSYLIYRSETPDIDPLIVKPYALTRDTLFTDIDPITNGANYYLVRAQDIHENISQSSNEIKITVDGLVRNDKEIPVDYALYQNYPNPFNPYTTIAFDLPENASVYLTIHNIRGQKVATLVNEYLTAGHYCYPWRPEGLASGLYVYTIETNKIRKVRKMVLLK